jgi:2-polyprenyl-6-methoxyphenol hydroxylase-like FAD-dependent oxidoreductase
MSARDIPVLIVGAGAAGTMLSLELARHGIEHRLVDRLAGPQTTSRAITVHARMAEILERIDVGLAQQIVDRAIHNKGYVLHFVDGEGHRSEVRPGIDFRGIDCRYPYILVNEQSNTEEALRNFTRERFGLVPDWSTMCAEVGQDADGVTAGLQHSNGDEEELRCQYLVACDGINSRVRRFLSVGQEESDYKGTVLQNMDVYLENFPDAEDWVHYCAGTDHFIMVVKLAGGFFRLLLSDRGEAADPNVPPERAFMRLVDQHFDGVSLGKLVWHSKWESWVRLAESYREGNIFLAGDSAHVHSTTGGQGMNCCMQDAYNLGWKLGYVLNGLARPELLETYVLERRPIAEQVIWAASSLHEIFMGHGKDIAERAQKISDPGFLEAVVGRCSGISYTYRDCVEQPRGLQVPAGPLIGDRAPDADLADGKRLFDHTRHTRFTLVAVSDDARERSDAERFLESLSQRYPRALHGVSVSHSPDFDRRYGAADANLLCLIRPDGYIGFRCGWGERQRLTEHLEHWLM